MDENIIKRAVDFPGWAEYHEAGWVIYDPLPIDVLVVFRPIEADLEPLLSTFDVVHKLLLRVFASNSPADGQLVVK